MSQIDVIKDVVRYEQLLRESSTNHILKGEFLIRNSQDPDMKQVLGVNPKATITNKEILGDKVMIEGEVVYVVFYLPKDENLEEMPSNKIHSVTFTDKFANYLDLDNDEHNIVCNVECDIEHIQADWMNERKVGINGVLDLKWEVYKSGEFEYVKDIEGKEDVQIKKKNEKINELKGQKEIDLLGKSMLKVSMEKSEIDEILNCSMNIHKREIKLAEDKIYIGCYCKIEVVYKGKDSKELITLQDDVYLSKEEEMPGISSEMVNSLVLDVKNPQYAVNLDDLGESRIVNLEFSVRGRVKVYSKNQIEMLEDAYSPSTNIEVQKDNTEYGAIHSITNIETVAKDNMELNSKEDRIEQIVSIIARPLLTDKIIEDDKVKVEGVVKVFTVYRLVDEDLNHGISIGEVPFIAAADIKGIKKNMNAITKVTLEGVEGSVEGNSISIRANLGINIKVCYKLSKEYVTDIIEGPVENKEKKASITIYVVSQGDTLWNLAKKYNTTICELDKINELEGNENIRPGRKLIIPGRAIF